MIMFTCNCLIILIVYNISFFLSCNREIFVISLTEQLVIISYDAENLVYGHGVSYEHGERS